ncbi:MAG: peptidylprolyl isomerase [Bradyrhizobium sp.]|uniref:peptidylprolyl isomerase n=1 Tax=Bradyrhizobium sp. TaxID=376 RepID=UPI0025BBB389|nr:peptidylprolyl isomerase [Bradyrhizobium sp.]MBI5262213.1 peptidylprolyl isomerase [Bradyrhizobium sp.]
MSCAVRTGIPGGKPVSVTVNGTAIARDAIVREMQHHAASKPIAAWQQAARALVIRELLLQEARRLAVAPQPISDADGRRETDEEAMMRALIEREVTVPEPDDETCRRYYEHNRARFRSPDIYEASHILFAALPADAQAYARARQDAAAALAELRSQPERFAALAQAHSQCPSAAQGGNLGQITAGQTTPEFEQALVALAPGQLCEAPVATRYGFHIIRLERKHEGRTLPYEVVASRIAHYLRESVKLRADAQYVARLVSAARIDGIELAGADALRVH